MKKLAHMIMASTTLTGVALAAPDKGTGGNAGLPGGGETPAPAPAAGAILPIRKAGSFKLPVKTSKTGRGGGKSPYPFDSLEIGDSFGVAGKTKKNFNSIVYGANQRYMEPVFSDVAKTIPVMESHTDRKTKIVSQRQKHQPTRIFEAFDVDPKENDGASVLIVRQPLPAVAAS